MATWAKSSQYRGMPHQQYMQTEEGQKAGQFFRQDAQRMREGRNTPQRTGFATGQAQSQQSPYTSSTPYQKNPAGDFAAYSPPQPASPPQGLAQPSAATNEPYAMPSRFQFRATDFTGRQYSDPSQMAAQQGATAQAINNQRASQISRGQFGSIDPTAAYSQGMQMLGQGFVNPFQDTMGFRDPMSQLSSQSFPSQYQGLTMAPQRPPQQVPQQVGLADSQPPAGGPTPAVSRGVRMDTSFRPGVDRSYTPVPGYGFDRQGNQVPVGKGGIYSDPYTAVRNGNRYPSRQTMPTGSRHQGMQMGVQGFPDPPRGKDGNFTPPPGPRSPGHRPSRRIGSAGNYNRVWV